MFAAISSTPGNAPSYLPETSYEQVAGDLCESMELFLVGREYARLCEGDHLWPGRSRAWRTARRSTRSRGRASRRNEPTASASRSCWWPPTTTASRSDVASRSGLPISCSS
jgi:hypothetical protein